MFLCLSFLFFLCVCILLLFPWFISTQTGKNAFISLINRSSSYSIKIEHLNLNWSGPQIIEGISIDSSNGKLQFSCSMIHCHSGLLQILLPSHEINILSLKDPVLEIHQNLLVKPIQKKPQIQTSSLVPSFEMNQILPLFTLPFIGQIFIEHGQVSLFSETEDPIRFQEIQCQFSTDKNSSHSSFSLTGTSIQNEITGSIFIESSCLALGTADRSIQSKIELKKFPVHGAAEIVSLQFPAYSYLLKECIGPSLNLTCEVQISKESCLVSLDAESKQLKTHLQSESNGIKTSLVGPAKLDLIINPSVFQSLSQQIPALTTLSSEDPISLFASVTTLDIPQTEKGLDLKNSAFHGQLGIKPFYTKKTDLTIGGIATVSSSQLAKEVTSEVQLQIQNKEAISKPIAFLIIKEIFLPSKTITGSIQINRTPSEFLDKLLSFPISCADLLGTSVEASLSLEGSTKTLLLTPLINSPLLQLEKGAFQLEETELSLKSPLELTYRVHPAVLSHIFGKESVSLKESTTISANLTHLIMKDLSSFEPIQCQLEIHSTPISFSKFFFFSDYFLENLLINLEIDSLSQISCKVKSPLFAIDWNGGFDSRFNSLFWKKPMHLHYLLRDQELSQFYIRETRPTLLTPAPIDVQIDPASIFLHNRFLNQTNITSKISSKLFSFENSSKTRQVNIENLGGECLFLGSKDTLQFSIAADLTSPSLESGTLKCQGSYQQINSSSPILESNINLKNFPLELLDTLTNSSMPIEPLIGSPLNLKLTTHKSIEKTICSLNGKTPLLDISGGFQIDSKGLFLAKAKEPLQIQLLFTPKSFAQIALKKKLPFSLSQDTLVRGSISTFNIPFLSSNSKAPDFSKILLQANLQIGEMTLTQKESTETIKLNKSSISLEKNATTAPLKVDLHTQTSSNQPGSLQIHATFNQILNPQGNFNLFHIDSELSATFQRFPSSILDLCFPSQATTPKRISSLLGEFLNANIEASLKNGFGPFNIELSSPHTQMSFAGKLKAGAITLDKNATVQIMLNQETSKFFLQEVNPLSLKTISAKSPITIEVGAKGFSLPLTPFSFKRVEIPYARITPGKIACQNEGNINSMLGLLKSKQADQNKYLELWFAPIDLHIQQGILDLERTEILVANTYDIAIWGKVDFPGNRVNMILGLTAPCLKTAFNIKDLPKDYVMHIPLTGTLDHVDLNKGAATSKIVALTLWQSKSAAGSAVGGLGGGLLGGVLNQVLAPPGNDASTPTAKTPFPWQSSSTGK